MITRIVLFFGMFMGLSTGVVKLLSGKSGIEDFAFSMACLSLIEISDLKRKND